MNIRMKPLATALALSATTLLTSQAWAAGDDRGFEGAVKDAWLDGRIETMLLLNEHLNPFDINTDVDAGKVVLTGKVDSATEKDLAGELVRGVDGVTAVDNRLSVMHEDKDRDEKQDPGMMQDLKDTSTSAVIKTRLLMSDNVTGTDIDVDTRKGVATLTGTVDNDAERQLAFKIAENVDGVQQVVDRLKLREG